MADANAQAATTPTDTTTTGQQPQAGGDGTTPQTPAVEGDDQTLSLEEARKLRRENQTLRTRATTAEGKVKEFETAQLSESDRLKKEADDARREADAAKREARNDRIAAVAARLKFADPEDARHFVADDADDIEAALKDVLKKKPYLAASDATAQTRATPTSPTSPARSATNSVTFTKAQIADRKFWTENRDAIMQAMREGRIVDE
ncbi:MAG TPA: hypothetical protein VFA21_20515 [Pyrinomonadaceae bacterium]|nr:hypothetical protein [Pyrinomonadaceae bacterium]